MQVDVVEKGERQQSPERKRSIGTGAEDVLMKLLELRKHLERPESASEQPQDGEAMESFESLGSDSGASAATTALPLWMRRGYHPLPVRTCAGEDSRVSARHIWHPLHAGCDDVMTKMVSHLSVQNL